MGRGVHEGLEHRPGAELGCFNAVRILHGPYPLISLEKGHRLIDLPVQRAADFPGVHLIVGVLFSAAITHRLDERIRQVLLRVFTAEQYARHRGMNSLIFRPGQ